MKIILSMFYYGNCPRNVKTKKLLLKLRNWKNFVTNSMQKNWRKQANSKLRKPIIYYQKQAFSIKG